MELVKIPIDYESFSNSLMETMPSIYAVAIIENDNEIVYSTNNWEISYEIESICSSWDNMNASSIMVSGIKYTMLECEIDSIVATSLQGQGHIVGCKDEERRIITYVEPHGDIKAAIVEISRLLAKLCSTRNLSKMKTNMGPEIKRDIEQFLEWINNPYGLYSYIKFNIEKDNTHVISELAKIYKKLLEICTF